MPTNAKTKARMSAERQARRAEPKTKPTGPKSEAMSALDLLEQDHRQVEEYFAEYEDLENDKQKGELAKKICMALTVHTRIEEEIFYPAARKATKDDELLNEAAVEHDGAKKLIAEIQKMRPGDDLYDAKVKVLGEQIKHHVEEEETELFPECESAKMDLEALGAQLASRKAALMKQPA
ncbi:MAG TPA: hemerythrin domain-containing protein [Stellaceae bacterium]|jgi:hemerythrin superfamily protein|nr:hemerythrin domain-containing protein [Stellaceae bacterium]